MTAPVAAAMALETSASAVGDVVEAYALGLLAVNAVAACSGFAESYAGDAEEAGAEGNSDAPVGAGDIE